MNDSSDKEEIVIPSSRFGELRVPAESVITFPSGVIGFPRAQRYVLIEHKPPFSWLHSVDEQDLAFVVVDGFEFGQHYELNPPIGNRDCDLQESDEYAILVIVTVRPDPRETTANLKAPIFVNLRNKLGVQIIYDDTRYSTRFPLWVETEEQAEAGESKAGETPTDKKTDDK